MHRWPVTQYFWVYLWFYFQKRLALKSIQQPSKEISPHQLLETSHPLCNKGGERKTGSLCLRTDIHLLLPSHTSARGPWPSQSDWDIHNQLPWFSGLWIWTGTTSSALNILQLNGLHHWKWGRFILRKRQWYGHQKQQISPKCIHACF